MKIKATCNVDSQVWTAVKEKKTIRGKSVYALYLNGNERMGYVERKALKTKGLEKIIRTSAYKDADSVEAVYTAVHHKKTKQGKTSGGVERKRVYTPNHVPPSKRKRPEK